MTILNNYSLGTGAVSNIFCEEVIKFEMLMGKRPPNSALGRILQPWGRQYTSSHWLLGILPKYQMRKGNESQIVRMAGTEQ